VADSAQQKWALSQDAFDGLLRAIDPDRDKAADRYLEIRRNLVRLFEWRGCVSSEDYADETINRCAKKIEAGEQIRDVATYAIGIARMVVFEMNREQAKQARSLDDTPETPTSPAIADDTTEERSIHCLRQCLAQLGPENRQLILNYYDGEKGQKIKNRKGLKDLFGIPANTLRMRALRLRERLQLCAQNCLEQA
jgi:DNA-directed RNA polymerase specialized sigma24 family protein